MFVFFFTIFSLNSCYICWPMRENEPIYLYP